MQVWIFFSPLVLGKAVLHQHLLCLLKLKPRQLNTRDLSFIRCLIAGSQGLAWALILTFMSQVSLAQVLWLQMAGLPKVGNVCYCHGYLFYFLLPARVPLPVLPFHVFSAICFPSGLSKMNMNTFQKSTLPGSLSSGKIHNKAAFLPFFLKPQFFSKNLPDHPA